MTNIPQKVLSVNSPEPIYLKALTVWGEQGQIDMAIEECAELIAALQHMRRDRVTTDAVASEIADVLIVCGQMRLLVGPKAVDEAFEAKMARLEARLSA